MLELYRYDVFGAPSIWGPPPNFPQLSATAYNNRFMFTGREYGPFGFYEYRARAYHPSLGRFMSEDPKLFDAGDYNLFRYCHNDPIDFTDPTGLSPGDSINWPPTGSHIPQALSLDNLAAMELVGLHPTFGQAVQSALGGLTMGDERKTTGFSRSEHQSAEINRTITALQAGVKEYTEITQNLKNYPPLQPIVDALRKALKQGDLKEGQGIQFSGRDNPFIHPAPDSKVIYYNPQSKLRSFAPELAHDGQHLVDRGTDGKFARERRAYNVTHGVGMAVGPYRPRLTDAQVRQYAEENQ